MRHRGTLRLATWTALAFGASASALRADDVRYYDNNGVTYRETRQVVRHPITETHLETRESTVYQNRLTTEMRDTPRSIPVAITEYHWTPVYRRTWNLFAPPVLTYELLPQTRWETRNDTVQTPYVHSEMVPQKVTQQVPVTTQRLVESEYVSRVAVGPSTGAAASNIAGAAPAGGGPSASVADRSAIGGIHQLDSDPPRSGATWRPATDSAFRR
jgi:hypothetical protein